MFDNLKDLYQAISIIDIIYIFITTLSVIKCYKKGFVLSILSLAKWILAYVITLILFPKIKPYFKDIIDSEYVLDIVEHVEGIRGNKKKTLAILLITKVVENATLDEDDKKLCMAMIDNGVIGDTIDLVVNAHNGKLDFGDVVETGSKCCFFILLKMLSDRKDNRQKRQIIKAKK